MSNDKMAATGYTPASDPWAALAAHGQVPPDDPDPAMDRMHYRSPGVPPWGSLYQDIGHEPPRRRGLPPWAIVSIVLGVVLLCTGGAVAISATTPPPQPLPAYTPATIPAPATTAATDGGEGGGSVLGIDWSTAGPPPANKRVIEVVDKIGPRAWRVSAAVNWLDKYTASDMRMVSRCSGKAYRCITVRTGRNKTSPGWSQGNTVTIDLKRTGALNRYYRYDSRRTWLLAHELGHQFGLGHVGKGSRTLMNPYVNRGKLTLTSGQRSHLRKR